MSNLASSVAVTVFNLFRLGERRCPQLYILAALVKEECLRYLITGLVAAEGSLEAWAGPQLNILQTIPKSPSKKTNSYLLTWPRKWRVAGSNTWSIIQPCQCIQKAVLHDHASPRGQRIFAVMTTEGCSYDLLYKSWERKHVEHPSLRISAKGQTEQQPHMHEHMWQLLFPIFHAAQISKPGWGLQGKQEVKEVILQLANQQQEQQLGTTTSSFYVPQSHACEDTDLQDPETQPSSGMGQPATTRTTYKGQQIQADKPQKDTFRCTCKDVLTVQPISHTSLHQLLPSLQNRLIKTVTEAPTSQTLGNNSWRVLFLNSILPD